MLPDLRPSRPLSTGPTLFLAPSPTAWQARHLLNDVLPASASCASALEAVAIEVTATSALKVSIFMSSSSFLPMWLARSLWQPRSVWTSHETLTGFLTMGLSQRELTRWRQSWLRLAYPNLARRA